MTGKYGGQTGPVRPRFRNLLVYPCRIVKPPFAMNGPRRAGRGPVRRPAGRRAASRPRLRAGAGAASATPAKKKPELRQKRLTSAAPAAYNPRSRLGRRSGCTLALSASPSCIWWVGTIRRESGALFDIVDIGKGCAGGGSSALARVRACPALRRGARSRPHGESRSIAHPGTIDISRRFAAGRCSLYVTLQSSRFLSVSDRGFLSPVLQTQPKSLILAQNERWRQA